MSNRHIRLKDEFTNDPEGIGYSGMTDQQRYDSLVLEDIAIKTAIPSESVKFHLEMINKWAQMGELSVVDQSQTPPVPRNSTAFHTVLVLNTFEQFDMAVANQAQVFNNLMNALVSNSILTQQEADDILAEGDDFTSRDSVINVANVTIGEIEGAR